MEIRVTSLFERHFKKLPQEVQRKAEKKDVIFRNNPFDRKLGTHKLHGGKKEEWSYWVDYSYRVTFIFLTSHSVLYTDIGTHDDVY